MAYIVSPLEEIDLRIDVNEFMDRLKTDWPGVQIQAAGSSDDPFVLHWRLTIQEHRQLGSLHPDLQSISIEDFPPGATRFALWYRNFVPSQHRLFLYDEGFNEHVELTGNSTETQILAALNSL